MVFHPGDLHQLRVHPRQVVVLQEVLADELVVRRDFVGLLSHHPPLVEPVVREALGQIAELLGERRGVRSRLTKTRKPQLSALDGQEAVVRLVEAP